MLVHSGDKQHICEICGKLFVHKGSLKSHIIVHTKDKPHSCGACGKSFKHKASLTVHMATHPGVKDMNVVFV